MSGANGVQIDYKWGTNGAQKNTSEYKRSTREYRGVQTEHNNPRELTSRAAQTGYKRSTKEYKRIQTEYKTKLETTPLSSHTRTNGIQTIINGIQTLEGHYIFGATN